MVHQRDVIAYLVAIKSFARFANPNRIVVICDPSIGETERNIFKVHIPHVELRQAAEFRDKRIPEGGTWERLFAITTYSPDNYVVQLDADTVTVSPIPEVVNSVINQNGFVIGEKLNQEILTISEASFRASKSTSSHIQALAEQVLAGAKLDGSYYVRGCSGFTGFPPDKTMQEKFFDFASKMGKNTNGRWNEWGTEQVTSNYLVANARKTTILPFPKYCTPYRVTEGAVFYHFIGEIRFQSRMYEQVSRSLVEHLYLT